MSPPPRRCAFTRRFQWTHNKVLDRVPDRLPNTASRLIAMAMNLGASAEAVRGMLGCAEAEFLVYRSGAKEPTWRQLDRVVMFIVEEQSKLIQKNRELIAEIRGKIARRGDGTQ